MRTIKIPFTRAGLRAVGFKANGGGGGVWACIAGVCILMLAVAPGWAQQGGSKAQRLEWPRLLSGQPDFAFTRDEALQEASAKAAREGGTVPRQYGLKELMEDQTPLDPMGLSHAAVSQSVVVGLGSSSGSVPLPASAVLDPLMANVVALPSFATSYTVDMHDFKASLGYVLSTTISNWRPQGLVFGFDDAVKGLLLQAVVTSPQKYAVINGQKYAEGDSFQLQVSVPVPDMELNAALQSRLPVSGTVPPEAEEQYRKAYEEVVGAFYVARAANPGVGRQTLSVPVQVKSIQERKVVLDIKGEEHVLQVRFAY